MVTTIAINQSLVNEIEQTAMVLKKLLIKYEREINDKYDDNYDDNIPENDLKLSEDKILNEAIHCFKDFFYYEIVNK
ncbi:hypothetical protein [Gloeothece verrucosa]|uniref:Uncharacterized protein n=1 Tax=Gloeothece verrucosa (strain PCC 7822) TaxID=497965 RepID=E0UP15_GLOV7|nr:hypothetical protein [Gloeothece verrucosa]ADN18695.1 hypothetical protein Cyan7822_6213 [Gloeothece verrucosa PCC 7822]